MTQQLIKVSLCLLVASVVIGSSDAEARHRCRSRGRCCGGSYGYGYANNCGYSGGFNNCGYNNCATGGCATGGCATGACGINGCSAASGCQNGCQAGVTTMNGQLIQSNATAPVDNTYSVGKPAYSDQNPQVINQPAPTPAPAINQPAPAPAPANNQSDNPAFKNTSPDPDNEGRNASKIQGTAPTKAPAPAANATP